MISSVHEDKQREAGEPFQEIRLADLVRAISRGKRFIASVTLGVTAIACLTAFLLPVYYTAEAVILPPQPEQAAIPSAVGAMAGLVSTGALGAAAAAQSFWRNPAELYVGVLKSRVIADALIERYKLRNVYGAATMTDARRRLARRSSIATGRDLLIRIRVEDRDPERAARLCNGYVEELLNLTSRLSFTAASRRRQFFQQELDRERLALAEAENALKTAQQVSGLVLPAGQSEALVRTAAQLRAEVAGREVQLESMRTYASEDNPQFKLLERETQALRDQLDKLREGGGKDDLVPATRNLPAASLEYLRRMRELRYREALFDVLSRQYEAARLEEARSVPLVQIVDPAIPPDKKSWPPRMIILLGSVAAAALGAALYVLARSRGVALP